MYFSSADVPALRQACGTLVYALDKSALSDYYVSYIMEVTENSVTFSAYRLSLAGQNQKPVVAKIGLDNVVTIRQDNEQTFIEKLLKKYRENRIEPVVQYCHTSVAI